MFYFFYILALSLEDDDQEKLLIPTVVVFINLCLLLIITKLCSKTLMYLLFRIWWNDFFVSSQMNQTETRDPVENQNPSSPTVTQQIISILKKPPKFLVKVSNTYYRPCDTVKITPFSKHKKSLSEVAFRNQTAIDTLETQPRYTNVSMCDISVQRSIDFSAASISKQCLICCSEEANAVIMDCGHGGICYSCSIEMWKTQKTCHICRQQINQVLEVSKEKSRIMNVVSVTGVVYDDLSDV